MISAQDYFDIFEDDLEKLQDRLSELTRRWKREVDGVHEVNTKP